MDSFEDHYRKDLLFSSKKEVIETKKISFPTISDWIKHRDENIMNIMEQLPVCDTSIAFLDLLHLETDTNPKVSFDVLVSMKCFTIEGNLYCNVSCLSLLTNIFSQHLQLQEQFLDLSPWIHMA